MRNKSLKSILL